MSHSSNNRGLVQLRTNNKSLPQGAQVWGDHGVGKAGQSVCPHTWFCCSVTISGGANISLLTIHSKNLDPSSDSPHLIAQQILSASLWNINKLGILHLPTSTDSARSSHHSLLPGQSPSSLGWQLPHLPSLSGDPDKTETAHVLLCSEPYRGFRLTWNKSRHLHRGPRPPTLCGFV